jgi:hypothetical protein
MLAFIDETGDHNLRRIDLQYPVFALGALLISRREYERLDLEISSLKRQFFDDDGTFVLHSSELKRPYDKRSDRRNAPMIDSGRRREFYSAFDDRILRAIDFKVIICIIRKEVMRDMYRYPADPYHFSFENVLNRIITFGGDVNDVCAEKRGRELDLELLSEYERLSKTGVHSHSARAVASRTRLRLVSKDKNVNGLQAIDLMLAALVRYRLGKGDKMRGNDIDPLLVEAKVVSATTFPRL